jgi:uncharacterized phage protein gp47/JayE
MSFGLLTTGFVPKTLTDIKADLEAAFQAAFGESIDLAPQGPFGQIIGILAERYAELWEVAQAVNAAFDPDAASGTRLVAICALTGTVPRSATASTVVATFTGTPGTFLNSGRTASVAVTMVRFDTTQSATILAATAWAALFGYVLGDRVTNGGNIYVCVTAGTSAGSGGPTTTAADITDGTTHWKFVGAGTGFVDVPAACEVTGPVPAVTGTLVNIETPVAGWSAVNNLADAVLGRAVETDDQLRARRQQELAGTTSGTVDALRTHVLEGVTGVTTCLVFQNDTDSTNGDGLPPHSVEVLVLGGADQDIRDAIWANLAAGITTYGSTTGTVTDAEDGSQTYEVDFSRPTTHDIYADCRYTYDAATFPADGDAQVQAALLAFGEAFQVGQDVVSSRLGAQVFRIPGLLDVTHMYIGTSPSPVTTTTITMGLRDLAVFDSSRITSTGTPGTP